MYREATMQGIGFFLIVFGCIKKTVPILNDQNAHSNKEHHALFDKEVIDNVIKSHGNELMGCHKRRHLKKSNEIERITVKFVIAKEGRVYDAIAKENTFESQKVTLCILNVFTEMQFPAGMQTDIKNDSVVLPDGSRGIEISYPLTFETE